MKGRKRYILIDTLGIPIACRVEPANMSDQRGAERLLGGLGPMFGWNRRMSKDYEYMVQTSETMIDLATIRLMLNRLTCS